MSNGSNVPISGSNNFLPLVGLNNQSVDPSIKNKRLSYLRYDADQIPSPLYYNDEWVLVYSAENAQNSLLPAQQWAINGSSTDTDVFRINAQNVSIDYLALGLGTQTVFEFSFTNASNGSPTRTFPTDGTRYLMIIDFSVTWDNGAPALPENTPESRGWLALLPVDGSFNPIDVNAGTQPNVVAMSNIIKRTCTPCAWTSATMGNPAVIGTRNAITIHGEFELYPLWPSFGANPSDRLNGDILFAPFWVTDDPTGAPIDLNTVNSRATIRIYRVKW
jgi:hypothetical protein